MYQYSGASPTVLADPSGLFCFWKSSEDVILGKTKVGKPDVNIMIRVTIHGWVVLPGE